MARELSEQMYIVCIHVWCPKTHRVPTVWDEYINKGGRPYNLSALVLDITQLLRVLLECNVFFAKRSPCYSKSHSENHRIYGKMRLWYNTQKFVSDIFKKS